MRRQTKIGSLAIGETFWPSSTSQRLMRLVKIETETGYYWEAEEVSTGKKTRFHSAQKVFVTR